MKLTTIIDLEKEPLIVKQAFFTAKGIATLGDKKLILELSESLTKLRVKTMRERLK